ncbi:MAG: hypothetical protein WAX89_01320 [Alphaproteobacteria bacterium]
MELELYVTMFLSSMGVYALSYQLGKHPANPLPRYSPLVLYFLALAWIIFFSFMEQPKPDALLPFMLFGMAGFGLMDAVSKRHGKSSVSEHQGKF